MKESENTTTTKINVLDFGMNKTKQNGNICIIIIPVGPQKKPINLFLYEIEFTFTSNSANFTSCVRSSGKFQLERGREKAPANNGSSS